MICWAGTHEHPLAQKLLECFASVGGPLQAIAGESLDLERITDYRWAGTYCHGQQLRQVITSDLIPLGDRPIDGLISFLRNYLDTSEAGLVVIEDFWTTTAIEAAKEGIDRRIAFYQDTVYHLITQMDIDPEFIEDTIRAPWHHWFVGVCAAPVSLPDGNMWSERTLDEIVAHVQHFFVPAFDDEGFLLWSPTAFRRGENGERERDGSGQV